MIFIKNLSYTIAIIPPIIRAGYIENFEIAYEDDSSFIEYIAVRVIETQKELLRLIG
jgi:hypothetical protein